ncbi:outer membrane beta-barrel protein [Methylocella tundrae]|nr:outer membrane beta-barrel protein [Methylocella tundrae]WPP06252.1 outer membrane beta-barrel protein [Methylocella tundrae]
MLRYVILASAGAMAFTGAAFAADLPMQAPPPAVSPPPAWTGLYMGLNAGYEWAANKSVNTTASPYFAAPTWSTELALSTGLASGSAPVNSSGFIGGFQVGYNYQLATSFVVGLEADIQGVTGSSSTGSFSGSGVPAGFPDETIVSTVQSTNKLDYLGTVRARLGYLVTPTLLIYGDGGLAYGEVQTGTNIFQANQPFDPAFGSFGVHTKTQVGWAVGGGLEWMFLPNWSVKAEYLYYNLGSVSNALSPLAFAPGGDLLYSSGPLSTARFNGNIVRAGINYHFNWGAPAPIVARY